MKHQPTVYPQLLLQELDPGISRSTNWLSWSSPKQAFMTAEFGIGSSLPDQFLENILLITL